MILPTSVSIVSIHALSVPVDKHFVYVEVLWPSQPSGVMSSAVSFLNHIFTGQAKLTSIVHILLQKKKKQQKKTTKTDNCPS